MSIRAFWLASAALAATSTPVLAQPRPAPPANPAPSTARPATDGTVGEVTVTAAPSAVRTSIDRKSYSVANDLQATTGSIGDALRNIPSVEVDVQGNVALRGDANVTILIDGKPSGMFKGEGKAQALQSLGADRIERVEVITNPSAAFNPEGTAGIINLITRKNAKPGTTGSMRVNVGSSGRQNGGLSASRKDGRFTTSGDAYLRHESLKQPLTSRRSFLDPVGGGTLADVRQAVSSGAIEVLGTRLGLDFDPDAKTRISAEVDYNSFGFVFDQRETLERTTGAGAPRLAYDTAGGQRQNRDNLEFTLGYRKKYADDHEFNISLAHELTDEDRSRVALRQFRLPSQPSAFEDTEYRNHFWRTQVKVDYARPAPGEAKLKAGYEFNADDNDYIVVFGRAAGAAPAAIDPTRSNLFRFDQQVHAVFGTYERPFGKVTALAGLRVEATRIDLDQVTQALKSENDYVRLYPSLHLSYRLDDVRQLSASYSHRVQRPQPQDYNAFRIYNDPNSFSQGNPDLKPQQSDSFELGYQYRKQGTIYLATAYYRRGQDSVNDVVRDLGGGVILQTKANIGEFQSAGLELVANGRLPGKVSYNVSGNLLWSEIDARGLGFGAGRRDTYTAFGRASLNWQATGRDFVQLQGFVNGKVLLPQGYREPAAVLNLGYRHKFSDKLSGVMTVQDLLNTTRFGSVIDTGVYRERLRGGSKNRSVFVGFTYAFGGGKARDGFDFGGGGAPGN